MSPAAYQNIDKTPCAWALNPIKHKAIRILYMRNSNEAWIVLSCILMSSPGSYPFFGLQGPVVRKPVNLIQD